MAAAQWEGGTATKRSKAASSVGLTSSRTLSDIFLARRSSTNTGDGGQLGHSLISAVTTSFLGCIAPLATEFER